MIRGNAIYNTNLEKVFLKGEILFKGCLLIKLLLARCGKITHLS